MQGPITGPGNFQVLDAHSLTHSDTKLDTKTVEQYLEGARACCQPPSGSVTVGCGGSYEFTELL